MSDRADLRRRFANQIAFHLGFLFVPDRVGKPKQIGHTAKQFA